MNRKVKLEGNLEHYQELEECIVEASVIVNVLAVNEPSIDHMLS